MNDRPPERRSTFDRLDAAIDAADRALVIGIGGGGDVVGALDTALMLEKRGVDAVVGGVSWERLPIDPIPGPRKTSEILNARPLNGSVLMVSENTRTESGVLFAESHMSRFLGKDTLLVDPHVGVRQMARDLELAALELDANLVVGVDVGGDVLARGDEPGLGSPLCDSVLLAAIAAVESVPVAAAIFGPCCDGELTEVELLGRMAALAASNGLLGVRRIESSSLPTLEAALAEVPTEASAKAVECARGGLGPSTIRGGRRTVPLSPLGATTFYFDPVAALSDAAPLAAAVVDASDLQHANRLLNELGVATELDWEHRNATRLT